MASKKQKTLSIPSSNIKTRAETKKTQTLKSSRPIDFSLSRRGCGVLLLLFFLFLGWYWGFQYQNLLYLPHYYKIPQWEDLVYPGGAVSLLGTLPSFLGARTVMPLGALLLIGYTALFVWGLWLETAPHRGDGRISPKWLLTLIPPAILTVLISLQGYYHFDQVKSELFYGAFPALGLALIFPYYLGKINLTSVRLSAEILFFILFYPLFGGYGAFSALYLVREEYRRRKEPYFGGRLLLPVLMGGLIPILWYPLYSARFILTRIAYAGWITLDKGYIDNLHYQFTMRLNWILFASSLLPLILTNYSRNKRTDQQNISLTEPQPPYGGLIFSLSFLIILGWGIQTCSKTDVNFLSLLAIVRPLELDQWDKILEIESKCPNPSVPLIEFRRLALAMTGQYGERLFERTNDPSKAPDLVDIGTNRLLGTEVELRLGLVNYAIVNINENLRVKPKSPFLRWSLVQSSLANGEYPLAEKHLALLKTLGRPDWYTAGCEVLDA